MRKLLTSLGEIVGAGMVSVSAFRVSTTLGLFTVGVVLIVGSVVQA